MTRPIVQDLVWAGPPPPEEFVFICFLRAASRERIGSPAERIDPSQYQSA
jgi:hypothetical protein